MTIDLFVDESGCIHLPVEALIELGVTPRSHVLLEISAQGAVIKRGTSMTPLTDYISSMNLPVADCDQMKAEIIAAT